MSNNLFQLTSHELHDLMTRGEVSCSEIVNSVIERISAVEPRVDAYTCLFENEAQAAQVDKKIARREPLRPLEGIPLALKDVLCQKGARTTCGSRILENFISPYDATVVERLRREGAVFVGRTNMDEFAMGSSTENSAFKVTRNPWDLERIPGGSSGGSAAAVAADEAVVALGSDTGGSIRQPAALCGIVGLKPTYGRVSRYGLVAFASSLDQIGPMTKDVLDCATVMNAIAGHDLRDTTSVTLPCPDYTSGIDAGVAGIRVGLPKEYFGTGLDAETESAIRAAVARMVELGAKPVDVSLPHTEYSIAAYYIIAPAEASSNLARYDGIKYGFRVKGVSDLIDMYEETRSLGFGPEVKRRIMIGTYALSSGYYDAFYLKAQKVRTLLRRDFAQAFEQCDVIVTPTSPTPAFKIGEKTADPLQMYLSDVYTISVNMAGLPGISVPCGFSSPNLPIGMQLIGKPFDEQTLLRVAYAHEQAAGLRGVKPRL